MRLSAETGDIDFIPLELRQHIRVTLDGEKPLGFVIAGDEAGYIEKYGDPLPGADHLPLVKVEGSVKFEAVDEAGKLILDHLRRRHAAIRAAIAAGRVDAYASAYRESGKAR